MILPQAEVYTKTVGPLVSACLEGYNSTVFAYGQTGSGKSHTMGSEGFAMGEGEERRGIIPRALEQLFQHIQVYMVGWAFTRKGFLFT